MNTREVARKLLVLDETESNSHTQARSRIRELNILLYTKYCISLFGL
jgi:hypothetical protein